MGRCWTARATGASIAAEASQCRPAYDARVSAFPDLAPVGALVGEPTRAAMLAELLDGRALTAGELAALAAVAEARDPFEREILTGLRFARTCYGHLAGRLGVALRHRLLERELIRQDGLEHRVTPAGERWFTELGIDLEAARGTRRSFARACLDRSERRPPLAGGLGDAMLAALVARGWVRRQPGERAVELTEAGRAGLQASLGLSLPAAGLRAGAGRAAAREARSHVR